MLRLTEAPGSRKELPWLRVQPRTQSRHFGFTLFHKPSLSAEDRACSQRGITPVPETRGRGDPEEALLGMFKVHVPGSPLFSAEFRTLVSWNRPFSSRPRQAAPCYRRDLPQRDQPGRRVEGVFLCDWGGFAHPALSPRSRRAGPQAPAPLLRRWAHTAGPAGRSRAPSGTKPE